MSILITGAAGFIGSHLMDSLIEDDEYNVYGIDNFLTGRQENTRYTVHELDIVDRHKLYAYANEVEPFEVEDWQRTPQPPGTDPALLKHVGGDLWAVLATWDLTPLEAAVLGQR